MKAELLEKSAVAGMGGPNIGTFLDRDTAILQTGGLDSEFEGGDSSPHQTSLTGLAMSETVGHEM